jgi:ribosomal protein S18 acetylase RimI-like enzyme
MHSLRRELRCGSIGTPINPLLWDDSRRPRSSAQGEYFVFNKGASVPDLHFRTADPDDAASVAALHTDSWRRHYRGAYSDSFLDGDVLSDRQSVWSARLADPSGTTTIIAEEAGVLIGFVHVAHDADESWGSLLDNLHVVNDRRRGGIGTHLLRRAARSVVEKSSRPAMYLWVLEQNGDAQRFYQANGGANVEKMLVSPPGGDPTRLNGTPAKLRMAWPDVNQLGRP